MKKLQPFLTKRETLSKFLLMEGTKKTLSRNKKLPEPKSNFKTPMALTATLNPFPTQT